ncbi:Holliday junction branch migration protein RuvA [Mycoplasma sp. E35C]|uniref:Holliday junction branch migration protein RuvA n=1 Tax=Mycoplasma sp. E35C TaxID=2801918 RepID=UPI001CA3F09C|nr:Holliday junction branch migration protein RuvA [Mycoplasma sp. E35C]QZX49035.1 Holliday junction branch migration protein RuvA [Mycoplasma sp. E35C]
MITSVYAKIEYVTDTKMLFVSNNWGYWVNVKPNSGFSRTESNALIFIHQLSVVNQNNMISNEIYAFKTLKEKEFFKSLLTINGIGPKTAINIMANPTNELIDLIKNNDLNGLMKLENINKKVATILLMSDLANKNYFPSETNNQKQDNFDSKSDDNKTDDENKNNELSSELIVEAVDCLLTLGYKQQQIEDALCQIDLNENLISDSADLVAMIIKQIGLRTNEVS